MRLSLITPYWVALRCNLNRLLARRWFLCIAGLVVCRSRRLEVILVDATTTQIVLLNRFDADIVRLVCETLRLGANQRWRNELALIILETKNVSFRQVWHVLERLKRFDELWCLHIPVQENVLHFTAVLDLKSIHRLICSVLIRILLLHFFFKINNNQNS